MAQFSRDGISLINAKGEYTELREMPASPLPEHLRLWFEVAKKIMKLPDVEVHYVKNEDAKKATDGCLVSVGAIGHAYEDGVFAFLESDMGLERNTIIHEMLHLKGWSHRTPHEDFEAEVERFYALIELDISRGNVE